MAISKKDRFEVFKRDKFTCQYCGARPPDVILEVDHVKPRADKGTDDPYNLTTSCFECNRGKSDRLLDATVPALDEMQRLEATQEMLERAVLLDGQVRAATALRISENDTIERIKEWWITVIGDDFCFQPESIRTFLNHMPGDQILEAIYITGRRGFGSPHPEWKYFCGCCWGMIRGDDPQK